MNASSPSSKQLAGWAVFGAFLAVPTTIIVGLAIGLLWAKVLADLWRWFLVPAFALPVMPFRAAYGLFLMGAVFTHGLQKATAKPDDSTFIKVTVPMAASLLGALVTWGIGAAASELLQ